jgi:hypothetical protein
LLLIALNVGRQYANVISQRAQWRAAKRDELWKINLDEYGNMHVTLRTLKIKHFKPMFQRAHAAAFSKERNMARWKREGISPKFNRREHWRFKSHVGWRLSSATMAALPARVPMGGHLSP